MSDILSKSLIKKIRFAHAVEHGAYYAYEGHKKSLPDSWQRYRLDLIQREEKHHIDLLEIALKATNKSANKLMVFLFSTVGKILGAMCFVTGWRLPMIIAGLLEKIGKNSYYEMAVEAYMEGFPVLGSKLMEMSAQEEEHEIYFDKLLKEKA